MIAYNTNWLDNLSALLSIDKAFSVDAITKDEKQAAENLYPVGFYTPNHFIRGGLFILTGIIALCSFGLLWLMILGNTEHMIVGLLFFFGMLSYAMLEFFVVKKHHYRSGVDDALLWTAGLSILAAVNLMGDISFSGNALLVMLLATYFTFRFGDMLMAAIATCAFVSLVFFAFTRSLDTAKYFISFVLMIIAAIIYLIAKAKSSTRYYENCMMVVQVIALLIFYSASNYFVVRELSNSMFGLGLTQTQTIPLAWLFWTFTTAIPVLYIALGLYKKDVVLLRVGLLLVTAVVFTIRNYYYSIPVETLMLWGGVLLTIAAYAVTRWLAKPTHGFTSAESTDKYLMDNVNIESLAIAQTFGHVTTVPDTKFGGGSFGGGGAGGEF